MTNIDYTKKMEDMKQAAAQPGKINEKICPFSMSHPDGPKPCTPQCILYRPKKRGYECYFMELQSISWFLKKGKPKPTPAPAQRS